MEQVRAADGSRSGVPVGDESDLGLRPIYHWKPLCSEAHLLVTVLAFQLVQLSQRRLQERWERPIWRTLQGRLARHQRVTALFRRADGRTLHMRKAT